jgi:cysteinyl-tRNA synthetase
MNITDVGHLSDDGDSGEDKLEKGALKYGKTVWEVADYYTKYFFETMDQVNILRPDIISKATEHVADMISMIQTLEEKGFTYSTTDAIYFDISKVADYGKLTGQKLEEKKQAVRNEVYIDKEKRHPADFALWFKRIGRFVNHTMHWDSPWGDGFPGWHIECSAMSRKYLGDTIDIHSGGVDHISIHHTNEIAQSEAATGKPFARFWFHNEFLLVDGIKMSKSLGNFYTIENVKEKGIDPLALRYLFLQSHYRQQMNFTWDSLNAANEGLKNLRKMVIRMKKQDSRETLSEEKLSQIDNYRNQFMTSVSTDLQIGKAIATMWELLKSNVPSSDKYDLVMEFDQILGLKLNEVEENDFIIPNEIIDLAEQRKLAKTNKDFISADEIRQKILALGYVIKDNTDSYIIEKK